MKALYKEMLTRMDYLEAQEKTKEIEWRIKELTLSIVRVQQLLLTNINCYLPDHIEVGAEAKRYAEMMNSKGDYNGFHEIDFYNGAVWLRQKIDDDYEQKIQIKN